MRNLYLTETSLTLVAIVLGTSVAFGHVQDGYRDTGCDPLMFTDIMTSDGRLAYRNNWTCVSPYSGTGFLDAMTTETPVAIDPEPETPVEPEPSEPVKPEKPHKPEKPKKPHGKPHRA